MTALNISFPIKGDILHCFHDIFVFGPAQSDLYILTDGALPLPAHLLSRIVANVKLAFFFSLCVVCTGYIKICFIVVVLMLIWSFLIYEPFLIQYIFL